MARTEAMARASKKYEVEAVERIALRVPKRERHGIFS